MTKVEVQNYRIVKPQPANMEQDPPHYSTIPLSSADFGVSNHHVRVTYVFQAPTPPTSALEGGLARVLGYFREWAGRLTKDENGRVAIELNDQGVVLAEARADGKLADAMPFVPSPSVAQFIPPIEGVRRLLLVQLTRFACGGLVIGVACHHMVSDGESSTAFFNCWGNTVRGEPINPLPTHDRSLLMARHPPRPIFDHIEYNSVRSLQNRPAAAGDLVVKKIGFRAELVNELRTRASHGADKSESRFVSLAAHMWRCLSKARGLQGEVVTSVRVAVYARNKLRPHIPVGYVGNAVFMACARATVNELGEQPLRFAANLVRKAIERMDEAYMRSAIDYLEMMHHNEGPPPIGADEVRVLSPDVTALEWMSLSLYDLDFGWGKPLYVGPARLLTEGMLFFLPADKSNNKDGGIDVVVGLFEPHMAILQQICNTI